MGIPQVRETAMTTFQKTMLSVVATLIGIGAGSLGMWSTFQSQAAHAREMAAKEKADFELSIRAAVTREKDVDGRLARLEERVEAQRRQIESLSATK